MEQEHLDSRRYAKVLQWDSQNWDSPTAFTSLGKPRAELLSFRLTPAMSVLCSSSWAILKDQGEFPEMVKVFKVREAPATHCFPSSHPQQCCCWSIWSTLPLALFLEEQSFSVVMSLLQLSPLGRVWVPGGTGTPQLLHKPMAGSCLGFWLEGTKGTSV